MKTWHQSILLLRDDKQQVVTNGYPYLRVDSIVDCTVKVFANGKEELQNYDIRDICKLEVIEDNVEIDIMTCIPDTDLDYYFRITVFPNGTLKITNVSDQYWDVE